MVPSIADPRSGDGWPASTAGVMTSAWLTRSITRRESRPEPGCFLAISAITAGIDGTCRTRVRWSAAHQPLMRMLVRPLNSGPTAPPTCHRCQKRTNRIGAIERGDRPRRHRLRAPDPPPMPGRTISTITPSSTVVPWVASTVAGDGCRHRRAVALRAGHALSMNIWRGEGGSASAPTLAV